MELPLDVVSVSQQLLALQRPLATAETALLAAQGDLADRRRDLADAEMSAWRTETVEGKNAEQRASHLRWQTLHYVTAVETAEQHLRIAQSQHRLVLEEIKSLRAVLHALGGAA